MCIYTVSGAGPGTRSPQGVSLPNDADNQKKRYKVDDNRQKALAAALAQIEKQYGKGSIMKMDAEAVKDIDVVSTGSLGLDIALGVGGLPRGRMIEIFGPEGGGKTTVSLHAVAEAQKRGGQCGNLSKGE